MSLMYCPICGNEVESLTYCKPSDMREYVPFVPDASSLVLTIEVLVRRIVQEELLTHGQVLLRVMEMLEAQQEKG